MTGESVTTRSESLSDYWQPERISAASRISDRRRTLLVRCHDDQPARARAESDVQVDPAGPRLAAADTEAGPGASHGSATVPASAASARLKSLAK